MKGMLYQAVNNEEAALECFEEANKLDPELLKLMIDQQIINNDF